MPKAATKQGERAAVACSSLSYRLPLYAAAGFRALLVVPTPSVPDRSAGVRNRRVPGNGAVGPCKTGFGAKLSVFDFGDEEGDLTTPTNLQVRSKVLHSWKGPGEASSAPCDGRLRGSVHVLPSRGDTAPASDWHAREGAFVVDPRSPLGRYAFSSRTICVSLGVDEGGSCPKKTSRVHCVVMPLVLGHEGKRVITIWRRRHA